MTRSCSSALSAKAGALNNPRRNPCIVDLGNKRFCECERGAIAGHQITDELKFSTTRCRENRPDVDPLGSPVTAAVSCREKYTTKKPPPWERLDLQHGHDVSKWEHAGIETASRAARVRIAGVTDVAITKIDRLVVHPT